MILLIGTVPCKTGVYTGAATAKDDYLFVGGGQFPIERGTAAMAAACVQVCSYYGLPMPLCILGGDVADGKGTALMFGEVEGNLERYDPDVITLHYLFPKVAYAVPFMNKVNSLPSKPQLVADAGGMYLMKAAKMGAFIDVFTPDCAELAFLADEFAPHPLYVNREIAPAHRDVDSLVAAAHRHKNAARTLMIKGPVDYVYRGVVRVGTCERPNLPAMEAIGGTGDTITGMVSALRYRKDKEPELKALRLNRLVGQRISCNPAIQIKEFIQGIPAALEEYENNRGSRSW